MVSDIISSETAPFSDMRVYDQFQMKGFFFCLCFFVYVKRAKIFKPPQVAIWVMEKELFLFPYLHSTLSLSLSLTHSCTCSLFIYGVQKFVHPQGGSKRIKYCVLIIGTGWILCLARGLVRN